MLGVGFQPVGWAFININKKVLPKRKDTAGNRLDEKEELLAVVSSIGRREM